MLLVDHREAGSGVVAALRDLTDVALVHLPLGDYAVEGRLLIERKTLTDLVASILDGRLFRQAARLAAAHERTVLLLEGTAQDLRGSRMRREAIQGALVTLAVVWGLPLLRARDAGESARLIVFASRHGRLPGEVTPKEAYPRLTGTRRPRGKRKAQLYLLQGLPGVGPERARRLLERFGSVEAVLGADAEALTAVAGIGPGTSNAIRWAVSEPTVRTCAYINVYRRVCSFL